MLVLVDLGQLFWANAYGGAQPLLGYEQSLETLDWYRREHPRVVVCADSPRSLRKLMSAEYKAKRPPKPQPAVEALEGVIARVRAWGMPLVLVDGWEADDVIATLARQAWPEEVQIVGTEKDLYCLIEDGRVQLVGKRGPIDSAGCYDKFGVAPSQMLDWLALVGDASDGVAGCEGCGPARATALLERFDSLKGILAATDDEILALDGVGKKTLAGLRAWDHEKTLSLLRMHTDLPIDLNETLGDNQ
jgi:DNA polymerase-1